MSTSAKQIEVETAEESGEDLPEGWISTHLPDVCELNPPKPHAKILMPTASVSFVRMPAVDADLGAITKLETRPFSAVRKGYTAFADNDVIMAKITPCMENGKAAVARSLENGLGFGSTEFHVLRSIGGVLPDYIYHFIRQKSFREAAENEMTGSVGQKRVPVEFLENTEIPLPPQSEQVRMIRKLTQLIDDTRSTRDRLGRLPGKLKRFRQAVLSAACSGKLTEDWRAANPNAEHASALLNRIDAFRKANRKSMSRPRPDTDTEDESQELTELPDSWEWCSVGQIATVCLGGTPSRKHPEYWAGEIPWVSSGEVANCRISSTRESITALGIEESNAKVYARGSVLIAMIGEGKTRGQSAILDIEACTNQNVAGLVFDAGNIDPEYVLLWALGVYESTRAVGRGGNQPALNGEKVRNLPLPLPPLDEQHEIVRRVDALFKLADAIDKRLAAASLRAERLTQAILAKAFRGELVPTEAELARREGREYEPASVLLERIKKEREKQMAEKVTTKRKPGLRQQKAAIGS